MRRKPKSKSAAARISERLDRRPGAVLALALGVIVAVRIVYLLSLHGNPFFDDPVLDSRVYDAWALRIASGDWLGREAFFMGPLYPYFLGAVYKIIGHSAFAAVAVQLLLGSASCLLVFLTARKLAGPLAALTAALILAFYGPLLFFEVLLLPAFLGVLINLAWLYLLVRREGLPGLRTFLVAGILIGLSALVRASALVFLAGVILWVIVAHRVRFQRALLVFGATVLGACLVIAPVTVRNFIVADDLVLVTSNGGLNFYIGNNEKADGVYRDVEGLHMVGADPESDLSGRNRAEQALGRELRPSEVSSYWLGESLRFIRGHPGRFASLLLRKVVLFWNSYEIPQVEDYYIWKDSAPPHVPLLSFALLAPLGIAGMALTLRRRDGFLLLQIFVLLYMVSICAFFVTARYRVQVVPVVVIFATQSVWWLVDRIVEGKLARAAGMLCVVVLITVATGRPMLSALGMQPKTHSWRWHLYRGTRFLSDSTTLDDAIRELTQAASMNPRNAEVFNNLGSAYEKAGMPDRAVTAFSRAVTVDSTCVEAWYNLAFLRQRLEDYDTAGALYLRVLRLQPYLPRAHFNLALCYFRQGMLTKAATHLRSVIELQPGNAEAHNQLGIVLGEQGDLNGATSEFRTALKLKPDYVAARRNLEMITRPGPER